MTRLPEIYEDFIENFGSVADAYRNLGEATHSAGPLDDRSRALVKLGIAIGAESEGAVRSHVRKALDEGIARSEIEHASVLSITTVGFPQMIAALKWSREVPARE
jgi:4-carboxymuconolactone decarboxylase